MEHPEWRLVKPASEPESSPPFSPVHFLMALRIMVPMNQMGRLVRNAFRVTIIRNRFLAPALLTQQQNHKHHAHFLAAPFYLLGLLGAASFTYCDSDHETSSFVLVDSSVVKEFEAIVGESNVSTCSNACSDRAKPWNSYHHATVLASC